MPRPLVGLAVATAAVATLLIAQPAAAADPPSIVVGPDGTTSIAFSYADAIRERVFVPVVGVDQDADGVDDEVALDIVRPLESGAGLKVPAIIDPSPYYTSLGRGGEYLHTSAGGVPDRIPLFYDNYFVPRGYAVIAAHAVGTAFSTGCPLHGGPGDIAGFKAAIDWLRGRVVGHDASGAAVAATWNSGRNAMIGKSYDGTFANGVAATGVEGLTTIVPLSAISEWYDYSRMGGIRTATNYPAFLSGSITNNRDAATLGVVPPDRNAPCEPTRAAMSLIDGDEDGDINPFWQDRDYNRDVAKVSASVFVVHGLNDENVLPAQFSEWWTGLTANNVPRKLWLSQEGHVDPFDFRRATWVNTLHRWFDYWLQGVGNGIMDEPQVDIETGPDTWETQPSWPLPSTKPLQVFLQGTTAGTPGVLGLSSGGGTESLTFTDANLSEANSISLATSQNNRLLFLSAPLVGDLRISGTPEVRIKASLSKTQSNLGALLVDYGNGVVRVLRVSDGVTFVAATSCWGESSGLDDACFNEIQRTTGTPSLWRVSKGILDSTNRDSLLTGEGSPVTPDEAYDFTWPLMPTDFTFRAGHQIGVVIGTTAGLGVRGTAGAVVTLDAKQSKLVLPVVGGYPTAVASAAFVADAVKPVLELPPTITKEATGPTTPATFAVTAIDNEDASPTVACTPLSGTGFHVGTTVVHCTATDLTGNVGTGSFDVKIVDTVAPSLHLPAPITATATSPAGAVVTFAATATDIADPSPSVSCLPASGKTFASGDTTVHCTATDASSNSAVGTFTVHVRGATELLVDLHAHTVGLGKPGKKSLTSLVEEIQAKIGSRKPKDACKAVDEFEKEAKAQAGKSITSAESTALLAEAARISAVLGC